MQHILWPATAGMYIVRHTRRYERKILKASSQRIKGVMLLPCCNSGATNTAAASMSSQQAECEFYIDFAAHCLADLAVACQLTGGVAYGPELQKLVSSISEIFTCEQQHPCCNQDS